MRARGTTRLSGGSGRSTADRVTRSVLIAETRRHTHAWINNLAAKIGRSVIGVRSESARSRKLGPQSADPDVVGPRKYNRLGITDHGSFSRPPPSTTRPSLRVGIAPESDRLVHGRRSRPPCVTTSVTNRTTRDDTRQRIVAARASVVLAFPYHGQNATPGVIRRSMARWPPRSSTESSVMPRSGHALHCQALQTRSRRRRDQALVELIVGEIVGVGVDSFSAK